jgi:hypothetical protein
MKNLLLLIALLSVQCMAQDAPGKTASLTTMSISNGRRWRVLSDEAKVVWLVAFRDGLMAAFLTSCYKANDATTESIASQMRLSYPEKLSYGEVRSALNHFYDTPENGPIPISLAMQVVVESATGVPQSKIDDFISSLRKAANN